jgi:hypothetical protein
MNDAALFFACVFVALLAGLAATAVFHNLFSISWQASSYVGLCCSMSFGLFYWRIYG